MKHFSVFLLLSTCAMMAWPFTRVGIAMSAELSVHSDPVGAAVYIDGRFAGRTPVTLSTIPPGDHRVRLVHDGYLEHSRVIKVGATERATLSARLTARAARSAQTAGLKIVVIEGEDAVNIIQQKTAVAPVVEVRDRNDQPVAGAIVTFVIRNGRATFSGARTLTITTNAAGRAAAAGLTPTGSGALQIGASAAFQGQTAAATIAQTNVMTAAQAANVSAAGAGGGGGGGIGTGTIVAIGAGAAGGIVGWQQYQKYVEGDPPTISGGSSQPGAGFQNATSFIVGPGEMTWHSSDPDNSENDDTTLRCDWGDGSSTTNSLASGAFSGPGGICRHVYSSAGTFTIRFTITDHWDRTASSETSVTVASVSGQWISSASAGVYTLTQTGGAITGSFAGPSGATGSVTGSIASRTIAANSLFPDAGLVILSLPTLVGSTPVVATFSTASVMFPDGDTNRIRGTLVGPGVNNPNVTLTRQ